MQTIKPIGSGFKKKKLMQMKLAQTSIITRLTVCSIKSQCLKLTIFYLRQISYK